jgi:hypothetical protein
MAGHEAKTCKQLRALLKGRNIDDRKLRLKAQLVAAVNESDSRKRKADEELEQENAKKVRIEYEALLEQAEERGLDSSAMTLEELREAIEIHDIQAQVEKRGLEVAGEYLWELREAIKNDDRRNVLLAQVAERGLEVFSTSLNALQDAIKIDDRRIAAAAKREKRELKVYQHKAYLKSIEEWRDESYRRLFQRDFKAVPGRRGLLDLPPHVRKLVYEYAFEEVSGMSPKIDYDRDYDRFEDYGSRSNLGRNTNLLNALGCLNKTVRHEARTTFWSMASFDLQPRGHYVPTGQKATPRAPYLTAIVERFLRGLGDDGRSAIKSLNCFSGTGCPCCGGLLPMDLTNTGYTTFLGVSKMLVDCSSLMTLRMAVSQYHLFRNDEDALKDLFLRGQPLKSEGLTAFQKTVQALLNLLNVDLDVPPLDKLTRSPS